jgi:ubiquinone/menaquinone biosynthesis C-methylase UbiE
MRDRKDYELREIADRKTTALCTILNEKLRSQKPDDILVVGCGSGREAATLAQFFQSRVVGIDIKDNFAKDATQHAQLMTMNATALRFNGDSFDLVYSFHALEHIPDYQKALNEMRRVLKGGGKFCIGTPNRRRMIGYLGSATSLSNKVKWNITDWQMRLLGRFENRYGAHAGFSRRDLLHDCQQTFGDAEDITNAYYFELYRSQEQYLKLAEQFGFSEWIFPCVYVYGTKTFSM